MNVSDLNAIADRTDRDRSEIRIADPIVTGAVPKDMRMKRNAEILYVESDPKMLEDRFARCRRLLHFLAARILGSQDETGDAVRNCRAAASRNPPSFESEGAFRSWLARILIDEACALIRRKQFSLMRSAQESSYQPGR
jgi:DNA-directed RNA polymerase specialized sigma24 family protein